MLPENYQQWLYCITEKCNIKLTGDFIAGRINIFSDPTNTKTQKFIALYGEHHYQNILQWYQQAGIQLS